ncbi:hypothetical protein LTR17_005330 [Elasticomyces elasticus]|nr:hypothetical protein LTR17_005330 [Elasticomyces elasticus]
MSTHQTSDIPGTCYTHPHSCSDHCRTAVHSFVNERPLEIPEAPTTGYQKLSTEEHTGVADNSTKRVRSIEDDDLTNGRSRPRINNWQSLDLAASREAQLNYSAQTLPTPDVRRCTYDLSSLDTARPLEQRELEGNCVRLYGSGPGVVEPPPGLGVQSTIDNLRPGLSAGREEHVASMLPGPADDYGDQLECFRSWIDARRFPPWQQYRRITHIQKPNLVRPLPRGKGVRPSSCENVDFDIMLAEMDKKSLEKLVYDLAVNEGADIHILLCRAYDTFVQDVEFEVRHTTLDLSHYGKEVWNLLNTESYIRGSVGANRAIYVVRKLKKMIESIREQAFREEEPAEVNYGTKKSAIFTLQEMATSVLLATSPVGQKVRAELRKSNSKDDDLLSDTMSIIVETLEDRQKIEIADTASQHGTFYLKIEYLVRIAKRTDMFPHLHCILNMLNTNMCCDDEEDSDDEEEDDVEAEASDGRI